MLRFAGLEEEIRFADHLHRYTLAGKKEGLHIFNNQISSVQWRATDLESS